MTTPYGVTPLGMREQFFQDRVLDFLPVDQKQSHANFLRDIIYQAIGQVIVAARQYMDWLQEVAAISADQNKPVEWTTPSGFKVIQEALVPQTRRIQTVVQKVNVRTDNKKYEISKSQQLDRYLLI